MFLSFYLSARRDLGDTDYALFAQFIAGLLSLCREFLKDISPEAQDLISKILEPDPIKRSEIVPACFLSDKPPSFTANFPFISIPDELITS
jgi:hypothetical protein